MVADAFWTALPIVVSLVTILSMQLAGRKDIRAWMFGIANQGLWLLLILHTKQWGLLILTVVLTVTYAQNYTRWSKEMA